MNNPTRGQWRGYAVLSGVLLVALLLVILLPKRSGTQPEHKQSVLNEAIERYGDTIVEQSSKERKAYHKQRKRANSRQNYEKQQMSYAHEYRRPERVTVELNSADTLDLQQLYGIGPAFARRIVKYRQLLGGFVNKEQLLEVYGMDEERYNGFVGQVTVDSTLVNKIAINSVSLDDLKRHPYIDYYQAKALVQFRDRMGPYHELRDLLKVNLVDSELLTKIQGYIQFN